MRYDLKTPSGRLKESGARYILDERAKGRTYQDIATEMGVAIGTVYGVAKGRTWGWLKVAA